MSYSWLRSSRSTPASQITAAKAAAALDRRLEEIEALSPIVADIRAARSAEAKAQADAEKAGAKAERNDDAAAGGEAVKTTAEERRLEVVRAEAAVWRAVAARLDAPLMYLDGPDYKKYVATVYAQETQLIKRLKLKEMLAQS